ncbi:SKI.2 family protein [Megaselia abdita]
MKEFVTPHLRTVLQTYQNSAPKSLQGPGHSLPSSAASNRNSNANATTIVKKEVLSSPEPQDESPTYVQPPPPPPEIPQPILSASDQDSGELLETVLEAKTIGCFFVGGELRLCLPQFLNTVLTEFSLEQINRIFEELCIFCSQCTPEQLNMFKDAKILPKDVKASGLITLTDAERLCSALLHRGCSVSAENRPKEAVSFKVYHKCFGKCEGICTPQLYTFGSPACIECVECKSMFSPQMFVGHAHGKPENRTCHWGFDSRNWRDYLHVSLEIVDKREIYNELLDNLKVKQQDEQQQRDRDLKFLKRKVSTRTPYNYHKKKKQSQ